MRLGLLAPFLLLLACTEGPGPRNIGSSDRPIPDTVDEISADSELSASLAAAAAVDLGEMPGVSSSHTYSLAELIDIAQRRNPVTREAWLAARQAGREVGVTSSALLPLVTASVIAGTQRLNSGIDPVLLPPTRLDNRASGAAAIITASWLLFDFGENLSRQQAADQLARVSGLTFNRLHHQLVYDVASSFHALAAANTKNSAARSATVRASQLVQAAERRLASGLGTEVELAQAQQLLAQTKLVARQVTGQARAASISLASALNVNPATRIRIRSPGNSLPSAQGGKMDRYIQSAFASRPEVLASLAQVRAAQYDLDATAASYLPKIYAGANLSSGSGDLVLNGFHPNGTGSTWSDGVFVGITIPIYDGKIKQTRQKNSQDRLEAARLGVSVAKAAAGREVALAYEALTTALAVHAASTELVRAATITADAADEAYVAGIGTLTDASFAALGEFTAREARADATRAAYQAAAALALATGSP